MEVIYQSDRYMLTLFNPSSTKLIVTFDHWERGKTGFSEARATKLIFEAGCAELSIRTAQNDWFVSDELEAIFAAASGVARDYEHVVNYGSSMGGFGALLFSRATNAREIYSISPQYSIDRTICGFETRWMAEAASLARHVDPADVGNPGVTGMVVFDPHVELDRLQAEKVLANFGNTTPVKFRFGGHPATRDLRMAKTIGSLGREIVNGAATPKSAITLFRQARRSSGRYWFQLGKATAERRPTVAKACFREVLKLARTTPANIIMRAGARLSKLGDHSGFAAMRALVQATENPPDWWLEDLQRVKRHRFRAGVARRDALER